MPSTAALMSRARRGLRRNRVLIDALSADADRQLAAVERRHEAVVSRASLLIAAAGVSGSLLAPSDATVASVFSTVATIASLAAAAVAVAVLFMRLRATEVDLEGALAQYWDDDPAEAIRNFTTYRMQVVRDDERALVRRTALLHSAFALFVVALAAAAAHAVCLLTIPGS